MGELLDLPERPLPAKIIFSVTLAAREGRGARIRKLRDDNKNSAKTAITRLLQSANIFRQSPAASAVFLAVKGFNLPELTLLRVIAVTTASLSAPRRIFPTAAA
jgi:hypothetical protein